MTGPEILHRLEGHKGVIFDVRFMGDTIASVSDDRSMRVWDSNGQQLKEFFGHRSRIWAVQQTKNFYATVSEDTTCRLWPKGAGQTITLKGHQGKNVRALATLGNILATGGEDGAIKVYDVNTLEPS